MDHYTAIAISSLGSTIVFRPDGASTAPFNSGPIASTVPTVLATIASGNPARTVIPGPITLSAATLFCYSSTGLVIGDTVNVVAEGYQMSQATVILPTSGIVSGAVFAADANSALDLIRTNWAGGSAPSAEAPEEGQRWLDTSVAGFATLRVFDGTSWLPVYILNTTTHTLDNDAAPRRTPINDISYSAVTFDRTIAYTAISAGRNVILPPVTTFPAGIPLMIIDESGNCNTTNTITVTPNAGDSTVNGSASFILSSPYAFTVLESNGANKWTILGQPTATTMSSNSRIITAAGSVTVGASDRIIVIRKTSPAATTVNLPATPVPWQTLVIKDGAANAATFPITVVPASGNIDDTATYVINDNNGCLNLIYDTQQWDII